MPQHARASYEATHEATAASCCQVAAGTIDAIADSLSSLQNPYADEFRALADRLARRAGQFREGSQLPGTERAGARLSLVP